MKESFAGRKSLAQQLVVAGALLLVAFVAFRSPLIKIVNGWRADRLAAEAHRHIQKGEWAEANRTALASMQLEPNLPGLRSLLIAQVQTGDPNRLQAAIQLFSSPLADADDRARSLRVCLDVGDVVEAARLVASLPAEDRDHPPMRRELLRYLLKARNYRQAVLLVDRIPETKRPMELELLLANGLAESGEPDLRSITAERLHRVLIGQDRELALRAMNDLAAFPNSWIHDKLARAALHRFENDPGLEPVEHLNLVFFQIGLQPENREAMVNWALANFGDDHADALLPWLQRLGEWQPIVDLTEAGRFPKPMPLEVFQRRAAALLALRRFDALEAELRDPPVTIAEIPLLCHRAALASKRGEGGRSVALWQDALKRADRDRSRNWFYMISRIAARSGDDHIELEALARGIERPRGVPPVAANLQRLFEWLYEQGDTERLLEISYLLLERERGNPTLVNNFHYLKVLHGSVTERDLEALQGLVDRFPEQPHFRSSLALALLKGGKSQDALRVLEDLPSKRPERSDAWKAIHAAVLTSLGRKAEARQLAAGVDWNNVSKLEAKFLEQSHLLQAGVNGKRR